MDSKSKENIDEMINQKESLKSGSNFLRENIQEYKADADQAINLNHQNYMKLKEIAKGILNERYRFMKLKASGFMDLVIEKVWDNRISLSHYYEQNGDLMADPDMEIIVDHDEEALKAASFQQDNLGIYQTAYSGNELKDDYLANELDGFLNQWLNNISLQGHIPYTAYYSSESLAELGDVNFDSEGHELEPELIEDDDLEM